MDRVKIAAELVKLARQLTAVSVKQNNRLKALVRLYSKKPSKTLEDAMLKILDTYNVEPVEVLVQHGMNRKLAYLLANI